MNFFSFLVCNYYILININSIIIFTFSSIYFNDFVSKKAKDYYEGDYYGLGTKHFFEKILNDDKRNLIKVAVASHTPIQRGLEALPGNSIKKFEIIGQEYQYADYIYKNNISEVDIRLNKKYEVPENFSKIYEFKVNNLVIYEMYKSKDKIVKLFFYKSLLVFFLFLVGFHLSYNYIVRNIKNEISTLVSEEKMNSIKEKLKDEMKTAIDKDVYLDPADAKLINKFLNKIKTDLKNNK